MKTIYLKFYGIAVKLESDNQFLTENIRRDFSFFMIQNAEADITIQGLFQKPDFKIIPRRSFFLKTTDARCYEVQGIKYINYLNKALSIYNLKEEKCRIISDDQNLLHEIAYITILSRVGEKLDLKSIHRIHALGFSYKDKGILCLSPMGGGKTTLGLGLLNSPHVKLISDDTPLINGKLLLSPFPIRIGIRPGDIRGIPPEFCRQIMRKRFGRKVLIDIEYFYPKIIRDTIPLKIIFIAKRENNCITPQIKKSNLILFIFSLFRDMILARGVAQVKEYFIRKSIKDIFSKIELLISRIFIAVKILRSFKPYTLYLCKDVDKNAKQILEFIEGNLRNV